VDRGSGYRPPKATAVRGFLERFHDEALEARRPPREQQKSFILPSSGAVQGLQNVQAGVVRRVAKRYAQAGQA